MTSGHLVARLNPTLDREVHLDDLENTRGKVITLLKLAFLIVKARFVLFFPIFKTLLGFFKQLIQRLVFHP